MQKTNKTCISWNNFKERWKTISFYHVLKAFVKTWRSTQPVFTAGWFLNRTFSLDDWFTLADLKNPIIWEKRSYSPTLIFWTSSPSIFRPRYRIALSTEQKPGINCYHYLEDPWRIHEDLWFLGWQFPLKDCPFG